LCSKSKFFRAACSERWRSGQEKILRLPDVEATMFERYVDWAYGNILVCREDANKPFQMLLKTSLLGDKFLDVKLRNKVMKAVASHSYVEGVCPGPTSISLVWDGTAPNSPLRNWIIDEYLLRTDRAYFKKNIARFPAEFTQQLALKFMEQTPAVERDIVRSKTAVYLEAEDGD
jgi:hypothetical protein